MSKLETKKFDKWTMPADEKHLPEWMNTVGKIVDGRKTYQYGKYEAAMKVVKQKRVAIDVGSHIGLWAYWMARDFKKVKCFEPLPLHIKCWNENMAKYKNAELIECALGEMEGKVKLETRTENSSGDTQVKPGAKGDTPLKTLDSFMFQDVDFIKIDCEGYEEFVLRGGEELLLRCKPVVVVEQKRDMSERYGLTQKSAVQYLQALGAKDLMEISGDHVMAWG